MKFCTNCGASLEDKALFCTNCGTMLPKDASNGNATDENVSSNGTLYPTSAPAGETTVLSECQNPMYGMSYAVPDRRAPQTSYVREANVAMMKKQPSPLPIKILCIFLSFVFCVVLATASMLGIARSALSSEKLEEALSSVKMDDVEKLTVKDGDEEIPVSKYILDFCDDEVKEKYGLDEDKVMKVLKKTKANEFVGEILGDYAAYLVEGEELCELNSERVINWIRDNESDIERVIEYEFTESDYNELKAQLDDSEVIKALSADELDSSSKTGISAVGNIRNGMSVVAYIAIIVLAVAVAALIALINRRKVRAVFTYVTVSATTVGGVFLVLTGGVYIIAGKLLPSIASTLISGFTEAMLLRGGIMFGVGLIASVIYKLVFDGKYKSVS